MRLNDLRDNPGARTVRTRVGRGIGSGKGKTAGKGHKGQKARTGVALHGFEGGQMPMYRRLPKRGFAKPFRRAFQIVNLDLLQKAVDGGKLQAGASVDGKALLAAGVVSQLHDGIRLLGKGELKAKLALTVVGASKSAVAAVEKAGGTVTLTEPAKGRRGPDPDSAAMKARAKAAAGAFDNQVAEKKAQPKGEKAPKAPRPEKPAKAAKPDA
jgi:large subunit ribosomal protein L15